MKVVSTLVAFQGGKRIRPGVPFEIPDGSKLGAGMSTVEDAAAKKAGSGDTKPAEAAAVAAEKQKAGQGEVGKGDTKPAEARQAAAKKAGGGAA